MSRPKLIVAAVLSMAALLSGCATPSVVQTAKTSSARSVVIESIPRIPVMARVTQEVLLHENYYFSPNADWHFDVRAAGAPEYDGGQQAALQQMNNPSYAPNTAGAVVVGALTAAVIDALAASSNEDAAGFDDAVHAAAPKLDLRDDFIGALSKELGERGLSVTVDKSAEHAMPRLRWPATTSDGYVLETREQDSPPVDADLLLQVCPVVLYGAGSVMNSYQRLASVEVAVYDGRNKTFLGRQVFRFRAPDSRFEYMRYRTMEAQAGEAGPALRDALVSLAPSIADALTGSPKKQ